MSELNRLLEPSGEFVRLAIVNIETRKVTSNVVDHWKPVLANAIKEWAKQRMLSLVLSSPQVGEPGPVEAVGSKIVTTQEELNGFETMQRLLGPDRPIAYEDTASYFKVQLVERHTWVVCRFYFDRKRPTVWIPLPLEESKVIAPELSLTIPQLGWTCVNLDSLADMGLLGGILSASWESQRALHPEAEAKISEVNRREPVDADGVPA